MSTSAAHERAEAPPGGISPDDAARIIRVLGASLIEAYGTHTGGDAAAARSAWGSKQREQLLHALVKRVAKHALSFQNAALSATDAAIATFAQREFEERTTRSHRDRAPIAKNVDKLVGSWLRRFGRIGKEDAVTVAMTGEMDLETGQQRIRLVLTFAYPWRIVRDRRLLITARFEELMADGQARPLPFCSDPNAVQVTLPDFRRRYTAVQEKHLRHLLDSMKSFAEMTNDPELAAYADRGIRAFIPLSAAKMLLICIVTACIAAPIFPQTRQLLYRVYDAIRTSESIGEVFRKLGVDVGDAMFVTPDGQRSPVVISRSGSEVRLSPGASPELMHIESSITEKDRSEITDLIVPLSDFTHVGILGAQFREAPLQPIVPWVVELYVAPQQDPQLAAELAAQKASISISYDPPLAKPALSRLQHVSLHGKRLTMASELRELPHVAQTYAVTATAKRQSGATQVHRGRLTVTAKGLMTLEREVGERIVRVAEKVSVGHPICTTILHQDTYSHPIPGQEDYVQAMAKMYEEQRVILVVYPLSKSPEVTEATVDWGDGGKADVEKREGVFIPTHTYRVGDRAYPITIYFKGSEEVFKFDLYVFKNRGPARAVPVVEYVTPYPPNPEITSLAELPPEKSGEVVFSIPPGPVRTESITFSAEPHRSVWKVPMRRRVPPRVNLEYVWRDGEDLYVRPGSWRDE
jgi:hypothetical protein